MSVSQPFDQRHYIHVTSHGGELRGLPSSWRRAVEESGIPEDEIGDNIEEILQILEAKQAKKKIPRNFDIQLCLLLVCCVNG